MSKEYLGDVLEKFAEVTLILMETSKLKEVLDSKGPDDDLGVLLETVKAQVDNLVDRATCVKEMFYKMYKAPTEEFANKNNVHNGEIEPEETNTEPALCDTNDANDETQMQPNKPIIKLVDINKLVEPSRVSIKPQKPSPRKTVAFDNNVVIITSSDDETQKSTSCRPSPKRKPAQETVRRSKLSLKVCSSTDSSENEAPKRKSSRVKNGTKKKFKDLDKIAWSESSTSSSNSSDESIDSSRKHSRKPAKQENNQKKGSEDMSLKTDPKLNVECYVKVLRIPCEKLKEYYLEKLELLEIKKLCNITSKKRKRRSASENSSDSDKSVKQKRKAARKKHVLSEDDSDGNKKNSDSERSDVGSTAVDSSCTPDLSNGDGRELEVQQALALLHDENEDKNDEQEKTGEEKDGGKETDNTENTAQTEEANKELGEESGNKDAQTEKIAEKNESTEDKTTKKAEEKEENPKKTAWKKDKLLTEKLSSTDSEEEFEKFRRKKELKEQSSDDEPKLSMDKKKRPRKKRMKKAILSDSDSDIKKHSGDSMQKSASSSSSESEAEKNVSKDKKPVRKRVKRVRDSSDEDEEEKSTRKQIRNIWGRETLSESTKQAETEEKERKARICEKQKKYNKMYEADASLNAKVEKVVLDFDETNKKELLKVDDSLVEKLKPHQASGVQFMWDACFESLERAKTTVGSGCILAHCMGLGKTLQVIALAHTLLINNEETNVRKVLVVSPINTVLNWVNEFRQWLPDLEEFEIYELVSFKQNFERQYQVKTWHTHGGVLIVGYDMFRNLSNPENKRLSKKMRSTFQEALVDPGPDLVICDEGHLLKNAKTNISIAMNRLRTLRRIVLTGTPLQNNLKEYFCMVQFVKPNLLGTYKEYLNRFVNPITNGQYTDSTQHDIQIMRKRSHVLHKMLDGVVQRRDYSVLQPYLPPKYEYVLFLSLTDTQIKLYQHYMDFFARRSMDGSNRTSFLFVDFQALQRICTHPRVLLDKSIEMKLAKEKRDEESDESEGSLKDFIDDDDEEESSMSSNSSSDGEADTEQKKTKKRMTRAAAALAKENGEEECLPEVEEVVRKEWWQEYCDGDELNNIAHSSKLFLLFEILKECEQIGDKVLVFSQSLYSLNVIEYFLGRVHDATQAGDLDSVNGYSGSWCQGLDYFRLDGSSSCDNRGIWCKIFNDPTNTRARLFLISTRAGGLGINLVAANRVIIFDVSWNPSHDIQSIYRVYRFGQTKPCYIYRFVTYGTMEMKIYERQVTKQAISKRVIDEQQIDRHYNQNDLTELYKFDPKPENRPTPLVPKDVLLGEMLQKFENRVHSYHEHQSLLENKEEEGLNEEERKAAWEEFENEKQHRNNLGANTGLMRAKNVEMALVSLLRKENPTWDDNQIMQMKLALHLQMQDQMIKGDLTLYNRVQQEMQLLHAIQTQKLREQFYQQQAINLFHRQQQFEAMSRNQGHFMNPYLDQMPSTSRPRPAPSNLTPTEVIDLND